MTENAGASLRITKTFGFLRVSHEGQWGDGSFKNTSTSHWVIHRRKHFSLGLYLIPQSQPQVCCRSNCEREHGKLPRRQRPGEHSERELGRDAFGDTKKAV